MFGAAARVTPGAVCALSAAWICDGKKLSRPSPTCCDGGLKNYHSRPEKAASLHLDVTHVDRRKNVAVHGLQKDLSGEESMQEHVYAWMGWSPQPKTPCFQALHQNFPGALPGPAILHRATRALEQFGLHRENTLYGQSICPDEINNVKGQLADSMREHWGECFPLGGIGGPPFVGKTGFGAFANHVPEGGNILILFGPHLGIDKNGDLGKHLRRGQTKCSTACGAFVAAYKDCCGGKLTHEQLHDPNDQQQSFLRNALLPVAGQIRKTPEPMAALSVHAYEIVLEQLEVIVNNDFGDGCLVLLGGIQLNMPSGMQDHFFPLMFQVRRKGKPTVDLLHVFDCDVTGKQVSCQLSEKAANSLFKESKEEIPRSR